MTGDLLPVICSPGHVVAFLPYGLNNIVFHFGMYVVMLCMMTSLKQRKIKFKPKLIDWTGCLFDKSAVYFKTFRLQPCQFIVYRKNVFTVCKCLYFLFYVYMFYDGN